MTSQAPRLCIDLPKLSFFAATSDHCILFLFVGNSRILQIFVLTSHYFSFISHAKIFEMLFESTLWNTS
jgi:hypothetical protein